MKTYDQNLNFFIKGCFSFHIRLKVLSTQQNWHFMNSVFIKNENTQLSYYFLSEFVYLSSSFSIYGVIYLNINLYFVSRNFGHQCCHFTLYCFYHVRFIVCFN
uniref:Uncharacterized protein n=1 Tax=Cacopsylla melanoneura TaxID=428564 RepID=A0A8D8T9X7_9HEMI